jgi:hypothetical protein
MVPKRRRVSGTADVSGACAACSSDRYSGASSLVPARNSTRSVTCHGRKERRPLAHLLDLVREPGRHHRKDAPWPYAGIGRAQGIRRTVLPASALGITSG